MNKRAIITDRLRYFQALEAAAKDGGSFRDKKTFENARKDVHRYFYGWYNGLKKSGWDVKFIYRPSYVIPETLKLLNSHLYIFLLKLIRKKPLFIIRLLDDALFNTHVFLLILMDKPRFIMFQYDDVWGIICKWTGVTAVSYCGGIPSLVKNRVKKRILRYDHVFSGYELNRLWPDVENKFYRIILGPSEESQYLQDYKDVKDIDVCIIGGFGGGIFDRRAKIVNELISRMAATDIKIEIFGYQTGNNLASFPALAKKLKGIIYGDEFYKTIKRTKIMLTIPSDEHIMIQAARPQGIMEAAASETFQLAYDTEDTRRIFEPDREIALFKNVEQLINKVKYYLDHHAEREAIAVNSFKRFKREYSGEAQIYNMVKRMRLDR